MRGMLIGLLVVLALVGCDRSPPAYESRYTTPTTTPGPAARPITVIGDSYTIQGPTPFPDITRRTLTKEGVRVVLGDIGGISGTGYVNPGTAGSTFGDRVRLVTPDDQVVVFVGSRNDWNASPEELTTATRDVYAEALRIAPNARLLVIGPIWPEGDPPPGVLQARDVVRDQSVAAGAVFVDPLAEGWMVGDPLLVKPDGVHPNEAGNIYLAEKFTPILQSVLGG